MKLQKACLIAVATISIILLACFLASAEEVDLSIIAQIESNDRADACSFRGCKYGRGVHQVSEILLKEWNNFNPKQQYKKEDLFDRTINTQIASWYLAKRIPQMIRHYKKEVTLENSLIAYNAGISYVAKTKSIPKETINYIRKYNKIERLHK